MGRNKIPRLVAHRPPVTVFKPAGVPARTLQWLRLALDEYEALRLADYQGLSQEEVAERLGVSRPTVSRILEDARRTVTQALVEGQALAIEGGPVQWAPGAWPGMPGPGHGGPGRHGWGWSEGEDREMQAGRGAGSGRGAGRGRKGGFAQGPGGDCVCPSCGTKTAHQRGVPCYEMKCPKCGAQMTRER
jgi:predicted DNA-binding protein (UPF0251 family)